jgi:hypothetical protein
MNEKAASAVLVRAGLANDARRRARSNRHSGGINYLPETRYVATGIARGSMWYYIMARRAI